MEPDLIDEAEREFRRAGVAPAVVRSIVQSLRANWGGSQAYIRAIDRPARDEAIRAALDQGLKPEEVAKRAGTSPATVRRRRSQWL